MTVQTTVSRADYTGNGSTTVFSVPFYFIDQTHLLVLRTQISTGAATTLTLTTDYTVSGVGVSVGGSITCTVAPTLDQKISILRNIPLTQLTHYVENDPFPAASHETALDKLTMEIQQVNEIAARALTLSPNSSGVSTVLPTPSANKLIAWDQYGTALQNTDPANLLTIVGSSGFRRQTFSGTGAQTTFTLTESPGAINNLEIFVSGVRQTPVTDYDISGANVTFTSAPPSGTNNILARWGQTNGIGVPSDSSVTPAKLSAGGPSWNTSGLFAFIQSIPGAGVNSLIQNTSATAASSSTLLFWNDNGYSGNNAQINFFSSGSTIPNEFRLFQGASSSMTFYTSGVERMRIAAAGDVLVTNAGGLGYGTGAGGPITQATSKSTAVTLNKPTGRVTMNNAALAAGASVSFNLQNTFITTTDTVIVCPYNNANYRVEVGAILSVPAGVQIRVTNITGGSLSEALEINFAVIKGATA